MGNRARARLIRFGLTGLFVTGVHFAVAILAIEIFGSTPPVANGIAFAIANAVSYLINTLWSFSSSISGTTAQRFIFVSALGLLLSVGISWSAQSLGLHYLLGIVAVATISPVVMFLLHHFWTYRVHNR